MGKPISKLKEKANKKGKLKEAEKKENRKSWTLEKLAGLNLKISHTEQVLDNIFKTHLHMYKQ